MKLIKINKPQVGETKEVPGLLNSRIEYEIKTAKGRLEYHGPKFTPELWHQVLSFFRWTHKEMQSESQVRLYVNYKLGRWGCMGLPASGPNWYECARIADARNIRESNGTFCVMAIRTIG